MNDKKKEKPKFIYHAICGIIVTFIPIVLPNISSKYRTILSISVPLGCFLVYFIRLFIYANWIESECNNYSKKLNDLEEKHDKLQLEYKKVSYIIEQYEDISSSFISHLVLQESILKGEQKELVKEIASFYVINKQDKLAKYHRKDDLL